MPTKHKDKIQISVMNTLLKKKKNSLKHTEQNQISPKQSLCNC